VQRVTPELDKDMGQQATSVPNELFFSRLNSWPWFGFGVVNLGSLENCFVQN
jgi:hypothetical protein